MWAGLSALLAGSSVCPCCGKPACPGGAFSAAVLGGLLTILFHAPRRLWRAVRALTVRIRSGADPGERAAETNRT